MREHRMMDAGLCLLKASAASRHAQEKRLLMVGLDGAGKTTILYRLKLNDMIPTVPTIGASCGSFLLKESGFVL